VFSVTSISALRHPAIVPALQRPDGDPRPLPYLYDTADQATRGLDVHLQVLLSTAQIAARTSPRSKFSPRTLNIFIGRRLRWSPITL
jgi:fumarylacetoacetase